MTLLEKTREAISAWRTRNDRGLIRYGARFAAHNDSLPVQCDKCGRYGHVLGAVVARTGDGALTRMDEHCARDDGLRFLRLSECLQRAAKLRISVADIPRDASPIGVVSAQPAYENAAVIYNATTGKRTQGHTAPRGAIQHRG